MIELPQLETRITAALDRIKTGLGKLTTSAQAPEGDGNGTPTETLYAQMAELGTKLNEEQSVNAQLEERVKRLRERQDGKLAELESRVSTARTSATEMDRELQRLRQVNAELRDINVQLREAVSAAVSDPQLINNSMLVELEALRATRAADAAEMDSILLELMPIIRQEAVDATD
ncbi:MAG: chromosome segregation ATPase [Octadecabacter sp.]|jgi:chromosome segregation ATPase